MQEMSEAEIYDFLTKDGADLNSIRKKTQVLRDELAAEQEKRVHALSKFDPQNQERHEREAARIFEEKSRKLDEILMRIAEGSSMQLPIHREAVLEASKKLTGSRRPANFVRTFVTVYFRYFLTIGITAVGLNYLLIYLVGPGTPNLFARSSTFGFMMFLIFGLPLITAFLVAVSEKG